MNRSCQVVPAGAVQAPPIRLQYLDPAPAGGRDCYGELMPVGDWLIEAG